MRALRLPFQWLRPFKQFAKETLHLIHFFAGQHIKIKNPPDASGGLIF
jgi:hypothetical protein